MDYVKCKNILQKSNSGNYWFGIDYNINLYKGCCHGCIYCDSRSSCYQIENFDTVRIKENCLEILNNELSSKRKKGVIGLGSMSDCYNPFEKKYRITEGALKLIKKYGYGVSLETKSSLVTRDIDLFKDISKNNPCIIKLSTTTADDNLSKIIEPSASLSSERFKAINLLSSNNIFCGILLMPVLPFINDTKENIISIVKQAHLNGAKFIYPYFGVTLRDNQRFYFLDQLKKFTPDIADKYLHFYGNQYECPSLKKDDLNYVFKNECTKYGLLYKMSDIINEYKTSKQLEQLRLF